MAKHPHKLILLQKKTWRCTLEGCSFFVHIGLAHVLVGKQAICWQCNDEFKIDYKSLNDEMPICYDCKMGSKEGMSISERENLIEAKIALARAGVKLVKDLDPGKRRMLENIQGIDFSVLENEQNEPDQIEVIEENE
jgi:hypothetical protein